jgi:hypothetical protein
MMSHGYSGVCSVVGDVVFVVFTLLAQVSTMGKTRLVVVAVQGAPHKGLPLLSVCVLRQCIIFPCCSYPSLTSN